MPRILAIVLFLSLAALGLATDSPVIPAGPYTTSTQGHNGGLGTWSWGNGTIAVQTAPSPAPPTRYNLQYNPMTGSTDYKIEDDPLNRWVIFEQLSNGSFTWLVINEDGSTYVGANGSITTGHLSPNTVVPE